MKMTQEERNAFVLQHQDIARLVAQKWARHCEHTSEDDLYQEAVLYVLERAEQLARYERVRGAIWTALDCRLRTIAVRRDSLIRVPRRENAQAPQQYAYPMYSLDMALPGEEGEGEFDGYGAHPAPVDQEALDLEALRVALAGLPEMQRRAVMARFRWGGKGCSRDYHQFCKELGVSAGQARMLVKAALFALRRDLVGDVEVAR